MCRVPTESDTAIKFVFDDTTHGVSCVIRAVFVQVGVEQYHLSRSKHRDAVLCAPL